MGGTDLAKDTQQVLAEGIHMLAVPFLPDSLLAVHTSCGGIYKSSVSSRVVVRVSSASAAATPAPSRD